MLTPRPNSWDAQQLLFNYENRNTSFETIPKDPKTVISLCTAVGGSINWILTLTPRFKIFCLIFPKYYRNTHNIVCHNQISWRFTFQLTLFFPKLIILIANQIRKWFSNRNGIKIYQKKKKTLIIKKIEENKSKFVRENKFSLFILRKCCVRSTSN